MNDILKCEEYKDILVSDIVYEPGEIFYIIKNYKFNFTDEVLKEAHITKTIRDITYHLS